MTNSERAWISLQTYERLQQELATLRELYSTAAVNGNADENNAAIQRARIQQIHDLVVNAVVGDDPAMAGSRNGKCRNPLPPWSLSSGIQV